MGYLVNNDEVILAIEDALYKGTDPMTDQFIEGLTHVIESVEPGVIYCKDCKWRGTETASDQCKRTLGIVKDDDFCSWGRKR